VLVGLAAASSGRGTVLGAPFGDRRTRRRIGYLPELFRYQPAYPVWSAIWVALVLGAGIASLRGREI